MPWIGDDRVAEYWGVVLNAAIREGAMTPGDLNDGQRLISEQQARYNYYRAHGWPIAAFPSCFAPHVRCNRQDHALDVNSLNGAVYRLAAWLRKHGARVYWTVRGEPWHIEVPISDLIRLYRKFRKPPFRVLKLRMRGERVKLLQRRLRKAGYKTVPGRRTPNILGYGYFGRLTRRAVKKFQAKYGLTVDGRVGPKTWAKLYQVTR